MRVCHLSSVHRGLDIRIAHKETATIARAGHEAHLVIQVSPAEIAEAAKLGIHLHVLELPQGSRFKRMTAGSLRAFNMARATSADIYHFHDPELIPYGLALKALGKRVIMDVHEDLAGQMMQKNWIRPGLRRVIGRTARALELFAARRFDAVVASSPGVANIFRGKARRLETVNNFAFVNELQVGDGDVPWSSRTKIAYVGGISRIRGIHEAAQALVLAGGVHMLLAGEFLDPRERAAAAAEPGWQYIEELGLVNRKGVRDVMAQSFAGMLTLHPTPNHITVYAIKMFEYMSAGIPVICSTIPIWQSIIEETQCGICVDPMNPQQIADAIVYLKTHPEEAQRMGQNGRKAVLQRYNWDQEGRKLLALYDTVLASAT